MFSELKEKITENAFNEFEDIMNQIKEIENSLILLMKEKTYSEYKNIVINFIPANAKDSLVRSKDDIESIFFIYSINEIEYVVSIRKNIIHTTVIIDDLKIENKIHLKDEQKNFDCRIIDGLHFFEDKIISHKIKSKKEENAAHLIVNNYESKALPSGMHLNSFILKNDELKLTFYLQDKIIVDIADNKQNGLHCVTSYSSDQNYDTIDKENIKEYVKDVDQNNFFTELYEWFTLNKKR